jgi:proteasome alpha subunit
MLYSPYDWNESLQHRSEYVDLRLRSGSPVAGVSYDEGVLLLTIRGSQRKIFEVYDRLMFSALGNQADLESVRIAAIDVAHQEGFSRSPDDVTIQRIVGFAISPLVKRAFADAFSTPLVIRALFAEVGRHPDRDAFFTLNYDGEFAALTGSAAVAGTLAAEQAMMEHLQWDANARPNLHGAIRAALWAWAAGRLMASEPERDAPPSGSDLEAVLSRELKAGALEAAVLERNTSRESKFRLLSSAELDPVVAQLL